MREDQNDSAFSSTQDPWDSDSAASVPAGSGPRPIGDVARAFGITPRTLRFYEARGLLSPARNGSVRLYGPAEHERLALLLKAKKLGFTLAEIRRMVAEPDDPDGAGALHMSRRQCFDQIRLLEQRKREIESALAELRKTYTAFYLRLTQAPR